jgi:hypothetical protein
MTIHSRIRGKKGRIPPYALAYAVMDRALPCSERTGNSQGERQLQVLHAKAGQRSCLIVMELWSVERL